MKQSLLTKAALCSFVLLFSCFVFVNHVAAQPKADISPSEENNKNCFVKLKDGSIREYVTLKLVTGVLVSPHLLANDKIVIKASDISAYQSDKHFAVSYSSLITPRTAMVSVETLPGFAVRVVTGKMNVYARKYYNGGNAVNEYFLQHGTDGEIVSYSSEMMRSFLKDNAKALDYYNSKVKFSPRAKKLLATAQIYNTGGELFSKN